MNFHQGKCHLLPMAVTKSLRGIQHQSDTQAGGVKTEIGRSVYQVGGRRGA